MIAVLIILFTLWVIVTIGVIAAWGIGKAVEWEMKDLSDGKDEY